MASWPNMGAKDMGAEKSLETMVVGALRIGLSQGSLFLNVVYLSHTGPKRAMKCPKLGQISLFFNDTGFV